MLGLTLTLCLRVATAVAVAATGLPGLACVCPGCGCCGGQVRVDAAGAASCCGGSAAKNAPAGCQHCANRQASQPLAGGPSGAQPGHDKLPPTQHRCGCCIQSSQPAVPPAVSLATVELGGHAFHAAVPGGCSYDLKLAAPVANGDAWRISRGHPPHARAQSVLCVWVI
ncbi:hypothetical protein Pla175_11960 [Pirellulimonas nuda]|uniref:Secreted protein n=1 Tax=Pirellulimonas nuda TaxID=2528009 RepID=A0A518D8M1_9BACT|nr:hypothetical protein [Pirellulimonas nuda]QDU87829.1 hypothetical protein Pla175_11960 [Pirellulimonas nuda]